VSVYQVNFMFKQFSVVRVSFADMSNLKDWCWTWKWQRYRGSIPCVSNFSPTNLKELLN